MPKGFRPNTNFVLLLVALGLGQGVTIIVLLALVWVGLSGLVGEFSLGFQMTSLALFVADFGGSLSLSRLVAARVRGGVGYLPRRALGVLILCRTAAGLIGSAALILTGLSGVFGPTASAFVIAAAPAPLFQVLNLSGALDGAGRSGLSGLSNTLYFIMPTIGLLFQAAVGGSDGFVMGLLFTLGVLGSVTMQIAYVMFCRRVRMDLTGSLHVMSRSLSNDRLRSLSGVFFYSVSGQVLARGQIIVAGLFFPAEILGAIATAKQIGNGASQVVGLFRRIELPRLVQRAMAGRALTVIEGLWVQKWGTLASVAFGFCFVAVLMVPQEIAGEAQFSLTLLASQAPALVTAALLAAAMQTCIARNQDGVALTASWATTTMALIGVWLVSHMGHVLALFLVEAVSHFLVFIVLIIYTRRV